jgi:GT2 family glycosyltransferase
VKVSIIIVSYNVKYFLEQCLISVVKAIGEWSIVNGEPGSVEVFVVDNHSTDRTVEYLSPLFPSVQFILNKENTGFSRANNQALPLAKGEYILYLNPDTIVPEDFFVKCISFLDKKPAVGAIGVQMIDGQGRFLKESKRGFPTLWASFTRLFGLTGLFPHSKRFAKYYLGHLDRSATHEVEALSGACLMVKKEVLDKTGGFDERFFMYAEDIDLSFRIHQLGYKNVYLADTTIIHFKGQSTTKDHRYVKLFYRAMIQFVEKHYSNKQSRLYIRFLKTGIRLREFFAFGSLALKETRRQPDIPRLFLTGDDASIREVKALELSAIAIEEIPGKAQGLILCEGKEMPFAKLIETMKLSPGRNYTIHAFGSSGVAGNLPETEPLERVITVRKNK